MPDPDAESASTVAEADAARLFEVRARQVASDFRIGDGNASAVANNTALFRISHPLGLPQTFSRANVRTSGVPVCGGAPLIER